MKTKLIVFLVILMQMSCRKSNYTPPVIPDSLFNWKVIGAIPNAYLDDIWFTSPSTGFTISESIYQTHDSGKTWTSTGKSAVNSFYNLFFTDSLHGFAQGPTDLAITVNGGTNWGIKSFPTDSILTIFFTNPSTGFCGNETGRGLIKTNDGGNSWTGVFNDQKFPQDYYPFFLNADSGFVATGGGTFAATTDGGQSWQVKSNNLQSNVGEGCYNQVLFLDMNEGFYACQNGVMKTTDGGASWNNVLYAFDGINVIKFPNAQTGYYKATSFIYKTADGGETWAVSCRLGEDQFVGMYFFDAHNGWACTTKGRILRLQE